MQGILRRVHMYGRFSAVVGFTIPHALFPIPLPLTMAATRRFGREDKLKKLHWMVRWAHNCRKYILKVDLSVEGRQNLPADRRGYMFVSNHQSYVDIPVLMEALDTVAFLSKILVKYIPLIGMHAYAGGTIYFKRKDKESRQRALEDTLRMCKESTAVVVFPEGTRSATGNLREKIYPSAIQSAYSEKIKVIPVGLDGTFNILPKSMDRVNLGQRVVVNIGKPMDPESYDSSDAWVDAVWKSVESQHIESRSRIGRA